MSSYFEIKAADGSQFMFNLKAGNHEVILTTQSYASKQAAEGGVASVKTNSSNDDRYERKTANDNSPFFVLIAANGEPIGKSQMYSSISAMEAGIGSVKTNAASAETKYLA